jgi:zinc transporter ZupT
MSGINLANLGIGLTALAGGLVMLAVTLRRHKRDRRADDPRGVAMLIAGMMVTAFGLFITAFAIAFATAEQPQ